MLKLYLFFILILFVKVSAQGQADYGVFPQEQEFYRGGKIKLFDKIRTLLKDHNLQPCEDDQQFYTASVLIRENATAVFVKDFDSANIARNRCAYDMFRKVLPHLKGWVPAEVGGKPTAAIAEVRFIPADHFEEKRFHPNEFTKQPEFPGGFAAFQKEFGKNFNSKSVDSDAKTISIQVSFDVNELGKMENIKVTGDHNWDLAVAAVAAVQRITMRWKPAEVNGKAVKASMRLPISMRFR
ncbi:energy transducer TonB [Chryseobacterium sp. cx-311]|uniref:energy transducer TonB n=1 Tax=Marnyiella aurantia TaxID=2758037 RepID=UPI001AE43892|nr:energy transducer TonB [Marnyiella aurantia]MBP0613178.1 energy transducer TonB [Marnyiella aurantia]